MSLTEKELSEFKESLETELTGSMASELTDEQLLELAEGSCTWGTGRCGS